MAPRLEANALSNAIVGITAVQGARDVLVKLLRGGVGLRLSAELETVDTCHFQAMESRSALKQLLVEGVHLDAGQALSFQELQHGIVFHQVNGMGLQLGVPSKIVVHWRSRPVLVSSLAADALRIAAFVFGHVTEVSSHLDHEGAGV
jgi:hypothetical protein